MAELNHVERIRQGLPIICVIYGGLLALQLWAGTDHRLIALCAFTSLLLLWVLLVHLTARDDRGSYWIIPVFAMAIVMAVAFPPATSKDSNSYALYGRMTAVYDASPYTHNPRDFAADPWYEDVSYFWSDSPSVYGPIFTWVSTAVMSVAGESKTAARIGFQVLAAGSLAAAVLIARRRLGLRSFALIGLNPLLLTFGVNDAHCDLMIGLFVLAAVLALDRRHFLLGGVALAAAALVKIAALPALGGAAVWALFRHGKKSGALVALGGVVTLAGGLFLAGGDDVLAPLQQAAGRHTRFSIWNPVHSLVTSMTEPGLPTRTTADVVVSTGANLTVLVVGLLLIWRHRRDVSAVVATAIGLVVYQLLGAYMLSWYAAWSLPALALMPRSRTFLVGMAHGSWVAIAYLSGYGVLIVSAVVLVVFVARTKRFGGVAVWPNRE